MHNQGSGEIAAHSSAKGLLSKSRQERLFLKTVISTWKPKLKLLYLPHKQGVARSSPGAQVVREVIFRGFTFLELKIR